LVGCRVGHDVDRVVFEGLAHVADDLGRESLTAGNAFSSLPANIFVHIHDVQDVASIVAGKCVQMAATTTFDANHGDPHLAVRVLGSQ
jgi:hypothetical protein